MISAKGRYDALAIRRRPFLDRARHCARLTVPSILPPEGHHYSSVLPQPNQGFGARCVLTLSSRLLTALLPPGNQFMRLGVTPEALIEAGTDDAPEDVELGLAKMEKLISSEVERRGWRSPTNLSLQHLIVTGNVMEQMLPDNGIRVFRLDQYVVVRDPAGKMVEFVIEEKLYPESLPPKLKAMHDRMKQGKEASKDQPSEVPLYTWGKLTDGRWKVHQELVTEKVDGSEGTYDDMFLPFFALRWNNVASEDYGRGKIEEHAADLILIDGLSKSMGDGSAMASRNITCIRPGAQGGVNLARRISKANNGEYIVANPEDVAMLQFTNQTGLQVTMQELQALRQEVGSAFLLGAQNVRNAERVTATEVRMMAQELEGVLGGVYSLLSSDMLLSRTRRLIYQMQSKGSLPDWPDGVVEPTILTGLEALGREQAVTSVMGALQMLNGLPPEVLDYVKWDSLLKKGFMGLELPDSVRTEEEAQAIRDQRMQQQTMADMASRAAGPVATAAAQSMPQPTG